jgi:hypothetical protein
MLLDSKRHRLFPHSNEQPLRHLASKSLHGALSTDVFDLLPQQR